MSEPAWLTAAVDQRLALMVETIGEAVQFIDHEVIVTPLTEPREGASDAEMKHWDFSCDNCGRYCPTRLLVGQVTRELHGKPVMFTYGACPWCAERE